MSFHFGGDEFLATTLDEPLDQVQGKCDRLLLNLQKQGYHVSLGIKQDHLNVSDLLYQAERPPSPVIFLYYIYDCRQKAGFNRLFLWLLKLAFP